MVSPAGAERFLTVGGKVRFAARLKDGVLSVEGGSMTDTANATAPDQELPASVDGIEVELRADVGRLTVTLDQLRQLGAGQVVEFSTPVESPVTLSVGGKAFASGELVDIGGRVGVCIVDIF